MRRTYKRKTWKKRMMMMSKMHQMVLVLARMKRRMKKRSLNYTVLVFDKQNRPEWKTTKFE